MRKIPVIFNGDHTGMVGLLEMRDDIISELELLDMHVSWVWDPSRQRVMAMSVNPMRTISERTQHGAKQFPAS